MPAEAHVQCYTHRQGTLTISVKKLPEIILPGERDGKIWMWHRCLKCPRANGYPPATRRVLMSDAAWGLSFGKFLELSFSNHAAASRVASCGHSLHRDCLRFYGYDPLLVSINIITTTWSHKSLPCTVCHSSVSEITVTGKQNMHAAFELGRVKSNRCWSFFIYMMLGWCSLGQMVACFRYASIDVHSVYLPPSKLDFNYKNQEWLGREVNEVKKICYPLLQFLLDLCLLVYVEWPFIYFLLTI